ncbi:MAG: hypothetical protein KME23_22535 [Goleter apudmare HA4340-LM2]|nr:hypothetical protein [Goleter apudmare HA4340-LM2]
MHFSLLILVLTTNCLNRAGDRFWWYGGESETPGDWKSQQPIQTKSAFLSERGLCLYNPRLL